MNAYDLSTLVLDNKISLVIGSFNIMSNIASRYALPDKDGYVRGPNSGESPNDWKKRYQLLIEMLTKKYFDILCIRTFPSLKNKEDDYSELYIKQFIRYAGIPVVSLESATLHPLQSLTDIITISEYLGHQPQTTNLRLFLHGHLT